MVKPTNTRSIETGTQTRWDEWCSYLDAQGAATLDHNSIVKTAGSFKPISGWWAQSVAVAYEQHIGRRKPGQTRDGLFSVSVSRTVGGAREQVHGDWCDFAKNLMTIDEQASVKEPTPSVTAKRLYWRCRFEDNSRVFVGMETKAHSKVLIAVEHSKLPCETRMKSVKHSWSLLLADCFNRI